MSKFQLCINIRPMSPQARVCAGSPCPPSYLRLCRHHLPGLESEVMLHSLSPLLTLDALSPMCPSFPCFLAAATPSAAPTSSRPAVPIAGAGATSVDLRPGFLRAQCRNRWCVLPFSNTASLALIALSALMSPIVLGSLCERVSGLLRQYIIIWM
jgi:hypothetical protein